MNQKFPMTPLIYYLIAEGQGHFTAQGQEVSYFNKLHICLKNVNNVSLKPYLSPDTTSAPSNMSFSLQSCSIHSQKHYLQCYFEACSLSFSSFILIFQSVGILVKSAGYFLTGNTI
jgi:hypothetical protein